MHDTQVTSLTPVKINVQNQVKLWISKDGLPQKHQARFIRLRAMNPIANIYLIVVKRYLTPSAKRELYAFSNRVHLTVIDYYSIPINKNDPAEVNIKFCLDREIEYFFEKDDIALKGNLSVVSDQLRLLSYVIKLGMMTDCDVEFNSLLPTEPIFAPLGFIARQKESGTRISNDLTAGDPYSPIFIEARRLVHAHNEKYDRCVKDYFNKNNIPFNEHSYSRHEQYYEARNKQLRHFSLCGGPQLFAIAVSNCGISTGYECTENEIFMLTESLTFEPYWLNSKNQNLQDDFNAMFPAQIGSVLSHWDTSWMPGENKWKKLNFFEYVLLALTKSNNEINALLINIAKLITWQSLNRLTIKMSPSLLSSWLSYFYHPNIMGIRNKAFENLPLEIQSYIKKNETPQDCIRKELVEKFGSSFEVVAKKLEHDGVLILPSFIQGNDLTNIQQVFSDEISKKTENRRFKQSSFSFAADEINETTHSVLSSIGDNKHLTAIIQYHFGEVQKWTAARGYRQKPLSTVRYRAWDFHHDNKAQGPYGEIKIMLLVNGVQLNGQAMRYINGSHTNHWHSQTLSATKFSVDEAKVYAEKGVSLCYGEAGTTIIFDTNGIHSGWRNLEGTRDVITLTYTPNKEDCPEMFNVSKLEKKKLAQSRKQFGLWKINEKEIADCSLSKLEQASMFKQHKKAPSLSEMKERFNLYESISLIDFLCNIVSQDLNADLDLAVREQGNTVIIRDNQIVKFRDASLDHAQYDRFKERLKENSLVISYDLSVNCLMEIANQASGLVMHPWVSSEEVRNCACFAADLAEAFARIDSIQRLRTQIIYLYFTLDRMAEFLAKDSYSQQLSKKFNNFANEVLSKYSSLVYLDDLNELNQQVCKTAF